VYVPGRPRIDEIEVKLIPDSSTLVANVLAGAVELTLGRGLSVEQAYQAASQWADGTVGLNFYGWMVIFAQMLSRDPAVICEVQFRQALMHAIDRQQMVDTLMVGQGGVGHSIVVPGGPEYEEVEKRAVRYEYDPRKAAQLIEALGYTRGADGTFRDSANQRLTVELRTVVTDIAQKSTFAVADYWQRAGVAVDPVVIPAARQGDLPYRGTYPGFQLFNQPNNVSSLPYWHGSQAPIPERNFVGNNYARYMSPELDALLDRYFVTIPKRERGQVLGEIIRLVTGQLGPLMPLFYNGQPTMIGNRLANVTVGGSRASQAWNPHEWDVK
jgi:peptide/nickel transport system substrate-binding protein